MEVTVDEIPKNTRGCCTHDVVEQAPPSYFPSDGLGVESAQQVCASCSVRAECLEYALLHRIEHGVWGGASERERRRILRRRRDMAPAPVAEPAAQPVATPTRADDPTGNHAVVQA